MNWYGLRSLEIQQTLHVKILNIIITTGLLLISSSLLAHTGIKSSSPENKSVLTKAPETLSLNFKSAVRLMKVRLLDAKQETVKIDFKPTAKAAKSFDVDLPALTVGNYKVNWMMMGKDGHRMKGNFSFTIDSLDTSAKEVKGLPLPLLTVYKSATCGCCKAWVDHMEDNGFTVESHDTDDLNPYKIKAKLGAGLGSCHTAFVDDYAIEGHVPADDVKRLLTEKPAISGLTAPGMPVNSPGMAPKGSKPLGYEVISFKDGEAVGVFNKY